MPESTTPQQRWLLASQVTSSVSLWLDIVLIFLVPSFVWHAGPREIALIATLFGAASLLLGPLIGWIADKWGWRKVLPAAILTRAILTALIAFSPHFAIFAALVLLKGAANTLYSASASIAQQSLIAADQRLRFFGTVGSFDQAIKVIAPLVVGTLSTRFEIPLVFLVSATALFIGIVPVHFLCKSASRSDAEVATPSVTKKLRFSVSLAEFPQPLRMNTALIVGTALVLAIYDPHLAAFLSWKGLDSQLFAWIVTATALGGISSAFAVRTWFSKSDPRLIRSFGLSIFVISVAVAAWSMRGEDKHSLALTAPVIWFFNGLGFQAFFLGATVIQQNLCPANIVGRVSASVRSLQMLCVTAGPFVGAALIELGSRNWPFAAATALGTLLAFGSIFSIRTTPGATENAA